MNLQPASRGDALAALLLLVVVNPLTHALGRVTTGLFPDSLLYIVQGREIIEHGRLFVAGWGHVDNGVVLPPLYPALVGLGTYFGGDGVLASYWVSTIAMALAPVPWFFLARRLSSDWVALFAVAALQLHASYLVYATSALTEGMFMLWLSALILWTVRVLQQPRPVELVALGAGASLLFLTRQMGLFFVPVLGLLLVLEWPGLKAAANRIALAGLGFLMLAAPYSVLLYVQSGQTPFVQSFRLNQYVVTGESDPAVHDVDTGTLEQTYEDIYRERREARRLLPDSSEMYANLVHEERRVALFRPADWIDNAARNLSHLSAVLGRVTVAVLGLALLSAFWGRRPLTQRVLPVAIVAYFGAVSLVSGHVARYIDVLFPFAILLIFAEAFHRGQALRLRAFHAIVPAMLTLSITMTAPQSFLDLELKPMFGERGNPLRPCTEHLRGRAPVFAFHPLPAYLAGGHFRVVPNDTLEKVISYGQKTGVDWLLLMDTPASEAEHALHTHADWVRDRAQLDRHPGVRRACSSGDGLGVLYRLGQHVPVVPGTSVPR